jgi:hypothetical protein
MKTSLELLNDLQVASPCTADWNEMTGDDDVRFCGECEKNVYDLSSLTSVQVRSLILEKKGKLCIRFYRRADGTVLTADCPVGVRQRVRRKRRLAVFAAWLAGLIGLNGCGTATESSHCTMGSPLVLRPIDNGGKELEQLPMPREIHDD